MNSARVARLQADTEALWRQEQGVRREASGHAAWMAGVDEVGRGCLAGPVVAAAVVLAGDWSVYVGVRDSKLLTKARRNALYETIMSQARAVGIGLATTPEIDELNILMASRIAMGRAVSGLCDQLGDEQGLVLADGPWAPLGLDARARALPIVGGDAKCLSIAAASIVAKVRRDALMDRLDQEYPGYGFAHNAGYGTAEHLAGLARMGPTPQHRRSFAPVRNALPG